LKSVNPIVLQVTIEDVGDVFLRHSVLMRVHMHVENLRRTPHDIVASCYYLLVA